MPKAEKARISKGYRHNPLGTQLELDAVVEPKKRRRPPPRPEEDEDEHEVLPEKLSKAILKVAKEQAEAEAENAVEGDGEEIEMALEENDDIDVDQDGFVFSGTVTAEEERAMALFMGSEPKGKSLADIIMEKIDAKERAENEEVVPEGLSPKVIKVYTDIAVWLKRYKSGKFPKAMKIVPNLINWEEILYLTNPVDWSPNAHHEATKLFASNMDPQRAQRFYNLVLLPAIRDNIGSNGGRLNFHLYQALKKAMYKPQAWLRGILLPLAQEACTLKEAVIVSSIIAKISIPTLHSAAAIMKLCQQEPWYGPTSVILSAFINKKYALPRKALDTLVNHFHSFVKDDRELPVVWHQCLLCFAQRYKLELEPTHKNKLKLLLRQHLHKHMGPEIRRELFAA
jgi:essential nuclear protein 1